MSQIEITEQTLQAAALIKSHFGDKLMAVHLFGSALVGGLKPLSDIDLLVTLKHPLTEVVRRPFLTDLLAVSAPPKANNPLRALEVTVIAHDEVVPWRYPPRRECQFGEWLREDILAGTFEPALADPDLAILLTKAREHSLPLAGPAADIIFEPVPESDFTQALTDTLAQWRTEADWQGDERNIILAVARIWYSMTTGRIAPKDVAATWLLERLPSRYRPVLHEARQAYLGLGADTLARRPEEVAAFILYAKSTMEFVGTHL